jgi:glycosyltransferase involved in cell wall biosynthesis
MGAAGRHFGLYLGDLNRASNQSHGIINYGLGLAGALAEQLGAEERLTVYANEHIAGELEGLDPRAARIRLVPLPANDAHRLVLDGRVAWTARAEGVDVLHFPKGLLPVARPRSGPALVTTIHDDIPMQYADGHFARADLPDQLRTRFIARLFTRSLRRSDCVITVSARSRDALRARLPARARGREIRVIGQGSSLPPRPFVPTADRAPVVLHLASPLAHKRTAFVIESMTRYFDAHDDELRLLVIGSPPPDVSLRHPRIEHRAGPVINADMAALMSTARGLLFPSATEGYGLPPIEAWLYGTPSVYDCVPALEQVAREVPGRLSASSYEAFAHALDLILALDDAMLREVRDAVAAVASWPAVAAQILDVYREYSSTSRS